MATLTLTDEQLIQAREWIADCQWDDLDEAGLAELTPEEIRRGIARNYAGGVAQFIRDGE